MKKTLSICLAALLAVLFLLPVAAEDSAATLTGPGDGMYIILDKTYTHLYFNDEVYSRADVSDLDLAKESRKGADVGFEEYNGVEGISLWATPNNTVFWIDVSFTDGSNIAATFLRDSARAAYERLLRGEVDDTTVNFSYPVGNEVKVDLPDLRGEAASLTEAPTYANSFTVEGTVGNGDLMRKMGMVTYLNGEFYYVDYSEAGGSSISDISAAELPISAYRITDPETHTALADARQTYLGDEMGFVYDDVLTGIVGLITLVFFFGLIPLALFVLFLILAIRGRGIYRRIHAAVCTCSGVTLAIFCIAAVWLGGV